MDEVGEERSEYNRFFTPASLPAFFIIIMAMRFRKCNGGPDMQKIPVAVLGATGSVGQRFIQLLARHPWFQVTEIAASDRSAGQKYRDRVKWFLDEPIPQDVANMTIKNCDPAEIKARVVFSGLDSTVAGELEEKFAQAGKVVISNAKNHRMRPDVPLIVPEINPDHLGLIKKQPTPGYIVTNPNCSTIGLVLALKPLADRFGLKKVNVVTMQAVSGAGYPGVPSLDIIDNVIPYINGEEEKIETEPGKILGKLENGQITYNPLQISAQCNRVPVLDGHTEAVQVELEEKASAEDLIHAWKDFSGEPQKEQLPSAPDPVIHVLEEPFYPQPRLHRMLGNGMAVAVGRVRKDSLLDYKFVILSHNTIRGAAGGTILIAELLKAKGLL